VLCPACHDRQHLGPCSVDPREALTLEELLILKRDRDPLFLDMAFLQTCSVKRLPEIGVDKD
jgi:hypothetical protein